MKVSLPKFSLLAGATLSASFQLAAANLVLNGDFENNTGLGELGPGGKTTIMNWTVGPGVLNSVTPANSPPFDFIMNNTASTTGAPSDFGTVYLKGTVPASPNGGDFIGADGGYASAPISQQIAGLAPNTTYSLSFDWAASRLTICDNIGTPCTGNTQDQWQVTFAGQTVTTPLYSETSGQFSGWMNYSTTFTTGSSVANNVLNFLALGTPIGEPPFLLLDSVSLTAVTANTSAPEPGSVALIAGGILSLIGVARRHKQRP